MNKVTAVELALDGKRFSGSRNDCLYKTLALPIECAGEMLVVIHPKLQNYYLICNEHFVQNPVWLNRGWRIYDEGLS